ncbi:5-methylcytosine rRNA methyltransferase NSUN4 [Anthonomus grandis grandis]|uniref:5-methylcytosine rRNA methyltransferase NSUN4 n=1 Tax=Anthonomus grandis grandis TaxID=2921223 RepID=UPI0021655C82|nr:5-methylcytosine rRNA methyltransferase NSUN4 [Anthonomus grandis grandis]
MISYSILKRVNQVTKTCVRYKNPPHHWSVLRKKVHPKDKALDHFDDFYKQVFKKKWPSIREGLLAKQKYVAIINNYGDKEETIAKFENNGAINVRSLFNLEKGYIKEEMAKNKRNRTLEEIWRKDREMEQKHSESNSTNTEVQDEDTTAKYSLETSMQNAELDYKRMVDSKNALSTEILNEFIPATKLKGNEDYIPESTHYKMFDPATSTFKIEKEYDMHFPENLNVYCYEENNFSSFEPSGRASTGVLNYYIMDGGSILPILALDLTPGCTVLDLCAAPGGKSLLAIQTLYPDRVLSNDISYSRVNRIKHVYEQFLYDLNERWFKTERVKLSHADGRNLFTNGFDRVLVDVPCTTDRHSLKENDNNIFKPSRVKERLKLPELQSELLFNALKLVKKGGIVVYSTCSLSPIQNDGVVNMALKKIWEETKLEFVVKDLTPALLQVRRVFELASPRLLRYGHLVLPKKAQNYGPTYFCKLERVT